MDKWTQRDEDSYRLPEGFVRIGYDADTSQYIFKDKEGTLYKSAPGSRYGKLLPIIDPNVKAAEERPEAFNDLDGEERCIPHSPRHPDEAAPRSFHDMLAPNQITSPTTLPGEQQHQSGFGGLAALVSPTNGRSSQDGAGPSSAFAALTSPTFKAALPRVQGVMQSLKRSMSSASRRGRGGGTSGARYRALSVSDAKRPLDEGSTYEREWESFKSEKK
ncbi:hypothetical protein CC1G_09847 [Coprinopsis cinerea okayama7|uniref:Carbohydrate-binding module family 50 protein n=1 Tax=Coprinopsis cinerea (strain Okayama-7 / 130 / ATCC MYA-4618 / FGSC 9003) TaxID=240176 RepID=A8P0D6_COPC7|nr:hypothetical protein CC1G_09847 [Coprinopsis cinerea okayama7\|eukprot:XP_001837865.1 hypothetical protein CC1G_09847 [Coprinopsis cinerea okayama7\